MEVISKVLGKTVAPIKARSIIDKAVVQEVLLYAG